MRLHKVLPEYQGRVRLREGAFPLEIYGGGPPDRKELVDLTLAVIGTGLLWVGWFGFNGGSALAADSRAAMAIVSTHLSASAGAFTWMALEWWTRGKPSVLGMISGAVAGLGTIQCHPEAHRLAAMRP